MRRRHLLIGLVFLLVLFSLPSARAQFGARLYPNETRSLEHLWGNRRGYYFANLTAGSWTVVVKSDAFWGMTFALTVSDANTSEVLAETEGPSKTSASLQFALEEDTLVNILVDEEAGEAGYFDIGVYDDFSALYAAHGVLLIIAPVLLVGLLVAIAYGVKSRGRRSTDQGMQIEAPAFVIPKSYRQKPEAADIRTVRLPTKCPSCGASLSQEGIDWTGPLEAKCNYCGSVVRARLERL